jgi:hypothetical protein
MLAEVEMITIDLASVMSLECLCQREAPVQGMDEKMQAGSQVKQQVDKLLVQVVSKDRVS